MEVEGSGAGAPTITLDQRYVQLEMQMVQMRNENTCLQEELKKKGKQSDRGRPP